MKRTVLHKLSPTAHGRRNAAGRLLLTTLLLFAFVGGARAQHESHWPDFDSSAFYNQGALYASLMIDGDPVRVDYPDWDQMEVAAFVGDELRMTAMFMTDEYVIEYGELFPTLNGEPIYYTTAGEEVTFKMYNHATGVEYSECHAIIWDEGTEITILTGEEHWEGFDDPDHPLMLNFISPEPTTLTKDIVGYGESETGGYYLIASPIGDVDPNNVGQMMDGDGAYELYYFDKNRDEEWLNYRSGEFTFLEPGKGYLYANFEDVTLTFVGNPYDGDNWIEVQEGWNLLGNPFNQNVYLVNENGDALPYYVMNEERSGFESVETVTPIGPMEGFFYYASEGGYVFLVTEEPNEMSDDEIQTVEFVLPIYGLNDNQDADAEQTQTILLLEGWNWVSFNVEIDLEDLKAALEDALPGTTITINSQSSGCATYIGSRWFGQLNSIGLDLAQMYQIKVENDCELTLEGYPIDPAEHPVTICPGYNWIAFPLNQSKGLTDAFAGFAVNGDKIISKNAQSQYTRGRWLPSQFPPLEPGQGYIYFSPSNVERVFLFPTEQ